MRFVWNPTDGALIPHLLEKTHEAAQETGQDIAGNITLHVIHSIGVWLGHIGVPLAAEGALLWGCICLAVSMSGTGKWLERGVKSLLASVLLGFVNHAV